MRHFSTSIGRNLALACGLVLFALSSSTNAASAAKTKELDTTFLRDFAETRGFGLGRPTAIKPTPDGKTVLFLRAKAREPQLELYEFDAATGQTRLLLTPEQVLRGTQEQLSPEEKARRERQRISVGGFTSFQLSPDGRQVLLSLSGRLFLFNRATGQLTLMETSPGTLLDPKFSPDGNWLSYVLDNDVRALELSTQREQAVTTGGTAAVAHGLAEFVAQEEMDRFNGYWWSPDSRFIAFEEADATDVEIWQVADAAHPENTPWLSYYPRPGKANVKVRLGVAPVTGGAPTWLKWDQAKYPYLTTVRWEEEGPLMCVVQTRDQKEIALLRADVATGQTTALLTEKDAAWVAVRQDVPRWLGGGRGFLWAAERGGDWQLEWRDPQGKLLRVLAPAELHFQALGHVDAERGVIYFNARPDPLQSQVYRVNLESGAPKQVTTELGAHNFTLSKTNGLVVYSFNGPDGMPSASVGYAEGNLMEDARTLPSVAVPPPFTPQVELARVGSGEGFYTGLVRPQNYNPRKRYPVLVNVYGGPLPPESSGMVTAGMAGWLMDQWLANQGFIVARIDGRGTTARGHDWIRALAGRFGSVPLEDQVAGLQALGKLHPEMDLKRVGIVGWSFGGYLSALAVMKRPDVFHAGVAGAPPADWLDYDTHYTERYLGLPQTSPQAYAEGSLLTYAPQLRRPLLIIHGTADDNVYFRHALRLADALFRAGKPFEFLPLSGSTHMTPDPVVTIQKWTRVTRFFQEHLGGPK